MGKVKKWKKGRAERMRAENVRRRHEALSARRPPLTVTSTLALPTTTHDASPLPATPAPAACSLAVPATPGPSSASSQDASSAEKIPSSHQKRMKMMQEIIPEPQGHFSKRYVISEEQLQAIVSRQKCPNATCKGSVQVKPTTLTDSLTVTKCNQPIIHPKPDPLSQLEVHQSPRASFTDDQEAELAEWIHKNPLFYNSKLKLFKDAQKKQRLLVEKAKEMNVKVSELKTWYSSMRTRYSKLLNRKSGSCALGALTERDSWIMSSFSFLGPYIERCPTLSPVVQPATVPVPVTQATQTNGVIVEEGVNDHRLLEEHTPSPVLPFPSESTAEPRPKRARQMAAGAVNMTADTLLEQVQERAESLSRVQEKLEKVLAPKSNFQEEVESFMHVLGKMALRLDMNTWMNVQQTLLADMSKACRKAQGKQQQQTLSSSDGPSAATTPSPVKNNIQLQLQAELQEQH